MSVTLLVLVVAVGALAIGMLIGARGLGAPRAIRRTRARASAGGNGGGTLEEDLSGAIERGELFLVHQPKVRTRTNAIEAVESLLRWQHPVRGLVGPNDFIKLAERRGEIRRITEWVIRQAIVEQRGLAARGHDLPFNVNISARILADRDFADWALATVRGASGAIGFEITETAIIADPNGALRNLHLFADAGIKIAIDDYGAGLSSLAYLKQLPANELKIDRMFISGLSSSHRDPLLVRSTIDLAHALEMEVTAEGVDSPAALALLRVMGCDLVQGFLLATPMRIGELGAFLDTPPEGEVEVAAAGFNWLRRGMEER